MMKGKEDRLKMRRRRFLKRLPADNEKPRLLVRKTLKHVGAVLIDDRQGRVLTSVFSGSAEFKAALKERQEELSAGLAKAKLVGESVARKALELGHAEVVFDRGGYAYHGLVKTLADSARNAGLKF